MELPRLEQKSSEKDNASSEVRSPPCPLPCGASVEQLRDAVATFLCDRNNATAGSRSAATPAWQSLLCPTPTDGGLVRCLICDFRTNSPAGLAIHLGGNPPSVPGKCALCSQTVAYNKANFCSIKAHLLFHLGIYLMCPQCGFTVSLIAPF